MIPLKAEYYRPKTWGDAVELFTRLRSHGRRPIWYGGGTEIITDARLGKVDADSFIDIKDIPEAKELGTGSTGSTGGNGAWSGGDHDWIAFGAGVTLADICAADHWPLLTDIAGRVAEHTTRCKVTLGGNIAGRIKYREAVLPFLLPDPEHCRAVTAGPRGLREVPFVHVFNGSLNLPDDEFLLQLKVPRSYTELPHAAVKRTRLDWVGYPLFTVAALKKDRHVRLAAAGLAPSPFRSPVLEAALNSANGAAVPGTYGGAYGTPPSDLSPYGAGTGGEGNHGTWGGHDYGTGGGRDPGTGGGRGYATGGGRGHGKGPGEARVQAALERALAHGGEQVLDDIHGSAEYRKFVFARTVEDILEQLGGPQ